jgi:hypothetical protein
MAVYRSKFTELPSHLHLSTSSSNNSNRTCYLPVPDSSHRTRPRTVSNSSNLIAYQVTGENGSIVTQIQERSAPFHRSGHKGTILSFTTQGNTLRNIKWSETVNSSTMKEGLNLFLLAKKDSRGQRILQCQRRWAGPLGTIVERFYRLLNDSTATERSLLPPIYTDRVLKRLYLGLKSHLVNLRMSLSTDGASSLDEKQV